MPPKTVTEQIDGLINALPTTGEVDYRTFHANVSASENRAALPLIHQLKREGRIKMRTVINSEGKADTFISRA